MKGQEAYEIAKNNIKFCYLCGVEEIKFLGCFVPDYPTKWTPGKPASGKTRTFWYGLCEKCFKLPNKAELVEKKMESERTKRIIRWDISKKK